MGDHFFLSEACEEFSKMGELTLAIQTVGEKQPDAACVRLQRTVADVCTLCEGALKAKVSDLFDTRFGIEGDYEVFECGNCGLEQIHPLPAEAQLKQLYETCYNFGGEKGTFYIALREWFFRSPVYRLWVFLDGDLSFHGRKGKGRLLDVGCNEGRGLKLYRRNGFDAEGLELNETAASEARKAGFTVHTVMLGDFQPRETYDVLVLSNVLEHSLDPKSMLLSARRVLKPGGQIWISCPNNRSWLRKIFGRFWINWHVPFHIVHFSPDVLSRLLSDTGFEKVKLQQMTPAAWVGSSFISRIFSHPGRPTRQLRNPFFVCALLLIVRGVFFPALIIGNWLGRGDCLIAVARARV